MSMARDQDGHQYECTRVSRTHARTWARVSGAMNKTWVLAGYYLPGDVVLC